MHCEYPPTPGKSCTKLRRIGFQTNDSLFWMPCPTSLITPFKFWLVTNYPFVASLVIEKETVIPTATKRVVTTTLPVTNPCFHYGYLWSLDDCYVSGVLATSLRTRLRVCVTAPSRRVRLPLGLLPLRRPCRHFASGVMRPSRSQRRAARRTPEERAPSIHPRKA